MTIRSSSPDGVDPAFDLLLNHPAGPLRPPAPTAGLDRFRAAVRPGMTSTTSHSAASTKAFEPSADGPPAPLRIYRPHDDAEILPAILFCHGGGFVIGDLSTHEAICVALAAHAGAAVVSVDYRRAPEHPFPGPLEDCWRSLTWLVENAPGQGIDAARLAVCGDSAGGHLAVGVAMAARDAGLHLQALGLAYPMVDPSCSCASQQGLRDGPVLTAELIAWFWRCYLGEEPGRASDPRVDLLRADLSGLPPTTVLTAEFDPLRDEGEALAGRLRAHDVPVAARRYLGMVHGFAGMAALTPVADLALRDLASDMGDRMR